MRQDLGYFFTIFGLIVLALVAIAQGVVRFENPKLTETELTLWALRRWWAWAPATAAVFGGCWLLGRKSR